MRTKLTADDRDDLYERLTSLAASYGASTVRVHAQDIEDAEDRAGICVRCGGAFDRERATARYCSTRCRVAAHRDRLAADSRTCAICNATFSGRGAATTCSDACRNDAFRISLAASTRGVTLG
ncbi:MAG: hypothetical protein ABI553_08830 [Chloroflexota bacterium]